MHMMQLYLYTFHTLCSISRSGASTQHLVPISRNYVLAIHVDPGLDILEF